MTLITSDRSDEGFNLPLVITKWRKRQKHHTVYALFHHCSNTWRSLSFGIRY